MPNAMPTARLINWQSQQLHPRYAALAAQFDNCITLETGRRFYSVSGDIVHLFKDWRSPLLAPFRRRLCL